MSAATAHSMSGGHCRADWPRLTLSEVRRALRLIDVAHAQVSLRWHSPRPLSAAVVADVGSDALFIKRHHNSVRTPAELEEEHRFIDHLYTHGAAVSRIRHAADGRSAFGIDEWTYEIHELGQGVDVYADSASWTEFKSFGHAVSAGRALARFHHAAQGYLAAPRRASMLVSNFDVMQAADPVTRIRCSLADRPHLREYLRQRDWESDIARDILPWHRKFRSLNASLPPLWTHNDWHASNLLWSDTGPDAAVSTILDFGLSDRTSAIYDLATAIERNTIPWLELQDGRFGAANLSLVSGLIEGYCSETALTEADIRVLAAMLPIVHVGYALAEVEYFHGITASEANADLAYDAFLLGHARWFTQPQGRSLLDYLSRWLPASARVP